MPQKIVSFHKIQGHFDKEITINRDQSQNIFIVDVSTEASTIDLALNLKEHANVNVYIYSLNSDTKRTLNVNTKQSSDSVTNIFIKCINAKSGITAINIQGTVPKHTHNVQLNQQVEGILLDNSSIIKALPSMIVDTNSIKASHAVNIGNINPEQLFYLMSRGIKQHDATVILLEGMFSQIRETQNPIYSDIKLKLNQMLKVK